MYKTIIVEKKERVAKITLNRPEKMNAMNKEVMFELNSALEDMERDGSIHAIIITGAGRAFCAGADLDYFLKTQDLAEFYELNGMGEKIFASIRYGKKIVIAAVNGYCLAGGFELISAADIVIASESAILGDEHINRGLVPGAFSVYQWGRILGPRKAAEVLLTGKRYTATEAAAIGIVNEVVPADKLDEAATQMASSFASKSMEALEIGKRALSRAYDIDFKTHSDFSSLGFIMDFRRLVLAGGVEQFVEKHGQ